ncbi:MAG TPA: ABC transporter substrate-binding protein [bacterium]|nr:ABC transporter substrate-binding protein [bacterium]
MKGLHRSPARILVALGALLVIAAPLAWVPRSAAAPSVPITFWTTTTTGPTDLSGLLARFGREHPDIAVTAEYQGGYDDMAQKVLAAIAGHHVPDVAQLGQRWGIPQMADGGALVPIQTFLAPADRADVLPALWDRFTYKGTAWVMPFNVSTPSLWYNRDAFRAAGLDPGRPPETWDALQRDARMLTRPAAGSADTAQWGFATAADSPWYFLAMVWQAGGTVVGPDGSVNLTSPEAVRVLRFWHDLVFVQKAMPPAGHKTAEDDFTAGRVAMLFSSVASRGDYQRKVGSRFALGDAFLPRDRVHAVGIGGNALGIFRTTPERERAAWTLVEFLTDPENTAAYSMQTGYVPVRKSALRRPEFTAFLHATPIARVGIDQLKYLHGQPMNPADAVIWNGLVRVLEQAETSATFDPKHALGDLQQQVSAYLRNYRR